jgi:hypothetical protein
MPVTGRMRFFVSDKGASRWIIASALKDYIKV